MRTRTKDDFRQKAVLLNVPEHNIDALWLYVNHGIETGGFLRAVLENDLMESFGHADIENRHHLFEICSFIYNELPTGCHGSCEKVQKWLASFRQNKVGE